MWVFVCMFGGGGALAFIYFQPRLYPSLHPPPPLIFNIRFPSAGLSVYVVCVCVWPSSFSPFLHLPRSSLPLPPPFPQGRLFSYADTHRHRLGGNYHQIPVNCPYATRARNYQRDGPMTIDGNQGESSLVTPPFRAGS